MLRALGDRDLASFADAFDRLGGRVFGSRWLLEPMQKWQPVQRAIVADSANALRRVFVFDVFIENTDRAAQHNPNLIVSQASLFAIDHGQSLPSVQGAGRSLTFPYASHVAWPIVAEAPHALAEHIDAVRALTDDAIDAAVAAVPVAWWAAEDRPETVRTALRDRRDRLPDTLVQLMERLG